MLILRYLLGQRAAIHAIAADRRFFGVGLLLTLSAALAREYDGEDLIHEPWYLVIPPAVSFVMGSCLAFGLWITLDRTARREYTFRLFWRRVLTCYWMTAPLAWLYAIPYERFLSELGSVEANLSTLSVVAVWRFCLTVRFALVLLDVTLPVVLMPIGFFVGVATFVGAAVSPHSLPSIMGGVRVPEAIVLLGMSEFYMQLGAMAAMVVCGLGTLIVLTTTRTERRLFVIADDRNAGYAPSRRVAVCAIILFVAALPFTQPEQILRRAVERDVARGRLAEAVATMSAHSRSDFPPHWHPPPPPWDKFRFGEALRVLRAVQTAAAAPWVRDEYYERFRSVTAQPHWMYFWDWWEQPEAFAEVLGEFPGGIEIARSIVERYGPDRAPTSARELTALRVLEERFKIGTTSAPAEP